MVRKQDGTCGGFFYSTYYHVSPLAAQPTNATTHITIDGPYNPATGQYDPAPGCPMSKEALVIDLKTQTFYSVIP